jgi:hypothetical protein
VAEVTVTFEDTDEGVSVAVTFNPEMVVKKGVTQAQELALEVLRHLKDSNTTKNFRVNEP